MVSNDKKPKIKPTRIVLPFDSRKDDIGVWAYKHRAGLCITLILYLILGIAFMSSKILLAERQTVQGIVIDMETLTELEAEKERLERQIQAKQNTQDWGRIQNLVSNENSEQSDNPSSNTMPQSESAQRVSEQMRANREAYEKGLAEEQAIINSNNGSESSSDQGQNTKVAGRVTASFSLVDPVRTSRYIHIPAYRCEGGDEVTVEIEVNQGGEVIDAKILSGGDRCMQETAISAARRSLFNIDHNAPSKQTGTITYIFIPQ